MTVAEVGWKLEGMLAVLTIADMLLLSPPIVTPVVATHRSPEWNVKWVLTHGNPKKEAHSNPRSSYQPNSPTL
jgi:hypothetical protein